MNSRYSCVLYWVFVFDYVFVGFIVDRWDDGIDVVVVNLGVVLGNVGIKL